MPGLDTNSKIENNMSRQILLQWKMRSLIGDVFSYKYTLIDLTNGIVIRNVKSNNTNLPCVLKTEDGFVYSNFDKSELTDSEKKRLLRLIKHFE